jgi:vacuolar-type H+-ATPase subunit I/STV1
VRTTLLFSCWLVAACGEPKVDPTIAQAVSTENEMTKAAEALAAKEKAEREAAAKARRELEERRRAEIDEAARLPAELLDDLADDLGRACEAVMSAHDEFMKRGNEKDVLSWHDGRRKALGKRRTQCISVGSVQVAACEAEALQHEFPALADLSRVEAARRVAQHCLEKFGS